MFVILNAVKNLIKLTSWIAEILRLKPQNDIMTQSLKREEVLNRSQIPFPASRPPCDDDRFTSNNLLALLWRERIEMRVVAPSMVRPYHFCYGGEQNSYCKLDKEVPFYGEPPKTCREFNQIARMKDCSGLAPTLQMDIARPMRNEVG